jgi:hypothetical protein
MDTKSSIILGGSLVLAALIVTLVPCWISAPATLPVGRFQLGGVPGHAYVLDTSTGSVWETITTGGSGSSDSYFKQPKIK